MKKSLFTALLSVIAVISALLVINVYAQTQEEKQNPQTDAHALKSEKRMFTDKNGDGVCDKMSVCHKNQSACCCNCLKPEDCCPCYMEKQEDGCAPLYEDLLERAKQLNLSEEQLKSLKHLAQDSAQKRKVMDADSRKVRLDLCNLLNEKDVDLTKVSKRVKQAAEAWADISYSCVRNIIEIRNILSPAQWNQWRKETGDMPLIRAKSHCSIKMLHAQRCHEKREGRLCQPNICH
jgi:uncharacterized membrane protein